MVGDHHEHLHSAFTGLCARAIHQAVGHAAQRCTAGRESEKWELAFARESLARVQRGWRSRRGQPNLNCIDCGSRKTGPTIGV